MPDMPRPWYPPITQLARPAPDLIFSPDLRTRFDTSLSNHSENTGRIAGVEEILQVPGCMHTSEGRSMVNDRGGEAEWPSLRHWMPPQMLPRLTEVVTGGTLYAPLKNPAPLTAPPPITSTLWAVHKTPDSDTTISGTAHYGARRGVDWCLLGWAGR